ncbi:hypothetical protein B9Z55_000451 [Caenorhabditis nigoni]|uniref:DUF38 domain-containing protein n=1 Tax=Caenorhabditis nigoni TaxID=1611254 RepID=A0A2G5VTW1_9PELO|nr:hypothetical protein B9Z55_000451 [Caenorhabditis nigoni]
MRPAILLGLILGIIVVGNSEKTVKTSIHSKWSQTSILAEISEFLASENENLFWEFMDIVNANCIENSTDVSTYNFGISTASSLLDPSEYPLLRFSLASRIFSPRIEVHRQISRKFQPISCPKSFFVYGNQVGCDLSRLDLKEYSGNAEIFEFDHIFPMKSEANRTLIIYGVLGTEELKNLVLEAKNVVQTRENLNFALRHLSLSSGTTKVSLSGYGVELALKNTEYKAVDHSTQDLPENLHGLNFRILKNRHTDRQNELESLRENLEKLGEIVPLKQWQLKDLGLKTCERIQEEGLEEIERVLQDFPIHARTISHRNLNESFTKSIQKFQKSLKIAGIENGENLLALNGRILSKSDSKIDLFELIETMKSEKKVMDRLMEIGSVSEDLEIDYSKLLTLFDFSPIDISKNAFDYRKAKPVFLNNLESFLSPYRSLHLLLQPFPSDQIRPIARNIFNLIFFIDPFDSEDKLLDLAQKYLKGKVFMRIGLVPFFNENKWGMSVQEAVKSKKMSKEMGKIWKTNEEILKAIKVEIERK